MSARPPGRKRRLPLVADVGGPSTNQPIAGPGCRRPISAGSTSLWNKIPGVKLRSSVHHGKSHRGTTGIRDPMRVKRQSRAVFSCLQRLAPPRDDPATGAGVIVNHRLHRSPARATRPGRRTAIYAASTRAPSSKA